MKKGKNPLKLQLLSGEDKGKIKGGLSMNKRKIVWSACPPPEPKKFIKRI